MLPEFIGEDGIITKEFVKYLEDIADQSSPKRHKFYDKAVDAMHNMGVHMTGDNPKTLLDIKRPNEDKESKKYRLDSYKPKTKSSANKATSIINRIYNERLFSINFPAMPKDTIKPEDSLQNYLTKDMPLYVSLMNYQKTVFTKMHLKDANALVGVLPIDFDKVDTELFDPIPIFYTSEELVDFEDEAFYTLLEVTEVSIKNKRKHLITSGPQKITIFTDTKILMFLRKKSNDDFTMVLNHDHNFGFPPAIRVGGVVIETQRPQLFESFIAGVLPHWDDAVSMFSDLSFAVINHLYPREWEIAIDCDNKGCRSGQITTKAANGNDIQVDCPTCLGTGRMSSRGPSNITWVNKDALNPDAPLPMPPFGVGEKELGSTELLVKLANGEIDKGFEAINMDIVNKVGENQSGISKVIDRQDLDSFLDVYSGHIFKYVLPKIIEFIAMWRYWVVYNQSEQLIKETLPGIKEPTTFDVFSISLLTDELEKLTSAGAGGALLMGVRKDIIDKRFNDEKTKDFFNAIIDVDPLAHLTSEQLMTQSRVIGQTEMYIHTYAKDLVEEVIDEKEDFLGLPLQEKKQIIRDLAVSKTVDIILPEPDV